jgi:hypothetical protein
VRTEELVESAESTIALTDRQADELRRIGQSLASQKQWWGAAEDEDTVTRSVVRCTRIAEDQHRVRVSDAVGVIGLDELQLIIRPKIPLPHLLYLISDSAPRTLYEKSSLGVDDHFFSVIARWFIRACEELLRHGLVSDYGRITGDLTCGRGRIQPVPTYQAVVLAGRPVIRCEFDRFGEDTSLNRVLKAAVQRLLGAPVLPRDLRQRCRRILHRFSDVGDLRRTDLLITPDALSRRYRDAHPLALLILSSTGFGMAAGNRSTWTFLFRTPEAVEEGVRRALCTHLAPRWRVRKALLPLAGNRYRTLSPDLVFGSGEAVGDVKYRHAGDGEIKREELNQVVTFATGYSAAKASIIAFGGCETGEEVHVGRVRVNGFNWNPDAATPEEAAAILAARVGNWLDSS